MQRQAERDVHRKTKVWMKRPNLGIEDKILQVRRHYGLGQEQISWDLARYHGIAVSSPGVYRVLKRHGVNRPPKNASIRPPAIYRRYEKEVPGHRV